MHPRFVTSIILAALVLPGVVVAGEFEQQAAELLKRLENATELDERGEIMDQLGEIGAEARVAIPALVRVLESQRLPGKSFFGFDTEADSARWVLNSIGAEAVPALIAALDHADPFVRYMAAEALEYMQEDAKAAVPKLVELTKAPQPFTVNERPFDVQEQAVSALGSIKEQLDLTIPALIDALATTDDDRALAETGGLSSDPPLALVAAAALDDIGPHARVAVPALCAVAKKHPNARARAAALEAIAHLDPDGKTAVPVLAAALHDEGEAGLLFHSPVRDDAVRLLATFRERAKPAIPRIVALLRDENSRDDFRFYGDLTWLLAEVSEADEDTAHEAVAILQDDMRRELKVQKRGSLSSAAIGLGHDAEERMKVYDSTLLRTYAAGALARIATDTQRKEAIDVLCEILSDAEWNALLSMDMGPQLGKPYNPHDEAARGLSKIGPPARRAAKLLKDRLKERHRAKAYADELVWALASIDPEDESVVTELYDMIDDSVLEHHWRADEVLRILSPHGEAYLPAVVEAAFIAHGEDEWDFWRSVLDRYKPDPKPRLIELATEEKDWKLLLELGKPDLAVEVVLKGDLPGDGFMALEDHQSRAYAAQALGKLGHAPQKCVPALVKALKDNRVIVRLRAAEALGKFGPRAEAAESALNEAQRDEYRTVREAATEALARIQGE